MGFWNKLKKPFFVLAPMDGVTDTVFRQIVATLAPPDVLFTEFASTDGLFSSGSQPTLMRLKYTKTQHPIVAQIWGNNPENYYKAAKLLEKLGFDGIDINMGCPDRNIVKKGCCSGLINNPQLALELINATKKGAPNLPISVKTRLGYKNVNMDWIKQLLEANLCALTIHGRTVSEMSKVPAHWDEIGKIAKMRNSLNKKTLIIGNGDVVSYQDAMKKTKLYGVDGIMIGRAIFTNPYVFKKNEKNISVNERFLLLSNHVKLFNKTWEGEKNINIMKKFYKMYIKDFDNAKVIREKLMQINSAKETLIALENLSKTTLRGENWNRLEEPYFDTF